MCKTNGVCWCTMLLCGFKDAVYLYFATAVRKIPVSDLFDPQPSLSHWSCQWIHSLIVYIASLSQSDWLSWHDQTIRALPGASQAFDWWMGCCYTSLCNRIRASVACRYCISASPSVRQSSSNNSRVTVIGFWAENQSHSPTWLLSATGKWGEKALRCAYRRWRHVVILSSIPVQLLALIDTRPFQRRG